MPRARLLAATTSILLAIAATGAAAPDSLFREEEIAATVAFLASPELEGRAAGERGGAVASAYIASRLAAAGCLPAGDVGPSGARSWFQSVPAVQATYDAAASAVEILPRNDASPPIAGTTTPGFRALADRAESIEVKAAVLFAGFGIRAPELGRDDYEGIDPRGKAVVVFSGEPGELDPASPWNGARPTRHLPITSKKALAASLGASALLVLPNPAGRAKGAEDLLRAGGAEPSSTFLGLLDRKPSIPVLFLDRQMAERMLAGIDLTAAAASLEAGKSASRELPGTSVSIRLVYKNRTEVHLRNVLARVGAGRGLEGEVVLLGAHFDHLGAPAGELHPGADDNASGIAGLLAAAAALESAPPAGARDVILAAWTAEERGQLGSTFFATHPVVPIERIAAAVNLDMLGRNDLDREEFQNVLQVIYAAGAPILHEIAAKANEGIGFDLRYYPSLRFRPISDHAPLFEAGIPIVYPFSGYHDDYHRPTDTIDKVKPARIARAARYVAQLVRLLAEHAGPIRLDPVIRVAPPPDPFPTPYGG